MYVYVPYDNDNGRVDLSKTHSAARCCIVDVGEDTAHVFSERMGIDGWYDLNNLYVPPGDPHI